MEIPKKPADRIKQVTKEKWITVLEGWATKYTSANIGFGIVIAILIVVMLASCFIF
jgi:hypothetical protein